MIIGHISPLITTLVVLIEVFDHILLKCSFVVALTLTHKYVSYMYFYQFASSNRC